MLRKRINSLFEARCAGTNFICTSFLCTSSLTMNPMKSRVRRHPSSPVAKGKQAASGESIRRLSVACSPPCSVDKIASRDHPASQRRETELLSYIKRLSPLPHSYLQSPNFVSSSYSILVVENDSKRDGSVKENAEPTPETTPG